MISLLSTVMVNMERRQKFRPCPSRFHAAGSGGRAAFLAVVAPCSVQIPKEMAAPGLSFL